jgi:glutamate synthases, NADH/NADPH, small subunit
MGNPTGFLEYERKEAKSKEPLLRIADFNEFKKELSIEEQQLQGARCMECGIPFCQAGMMIEGMTSGCPLHNLVPELNDLVYSGKWKQAYERLAKNHSFPEFTSHVCPALCEAACTCNINGEPVSSRENEKAIIEMAFKAGWVIPQEVKVRTEKKVAVVGSGPAGLAAAQLLNQKGHWVTVFERSDRIGGLLQYGIPNMKLDKTIIERRVKILEAEGIVFKTGVDIGKDVKAAELSKEFDRIILACGASNPRDIEAIGRDANNIYFAVDFLKSVTKSLLASNLKDEQFVQVKGKNVIVIGGGDTGNDCVGTVIRLGAKSVVQLEMMAKPPEVRSADNPWPEWPKILKIDYGQEEAIAVFGQDPRRYQTTVKEFIKDGKGNVEKVKIVKLEVQKDEKTGFIKMVPVENSEEVINAQVVLIAAGFLGSQEYVIDAFKISVDARDNVMTPEAEYQTNVANIFTAGDMHRGQSLVVWAITEGRAAAKAVDRSLMGYTI